MDSELRPRLKRTNQDEAMHPGKISKLTSDDIDEAPKLRSIKPPCSFIHLQEILQAHRSALSENVQDLETRRPATHELSAEEQLYYEVLTEDCIGSHDRKRTAALETLASDLAIITILPKLCLFISEGVHINVVEKNLLFLLYLMRMVNALVLNSSISLDYFIDQIIPSVAMCIVSKELCKHKSHNHWALRDFASRIMAQIWKDYNSHRNKIETRFTVILANVLLIQSDEVPLPTLYGALAGLTELGIDVVRVSILPKMRLIGERIKFPLKDNRSSYADKSALGRIKELLLEVIAPMLRSIRKMPNNNVEAYVQDYGYLGRALYNAVSKNPTQPTPSTSTSFSF